MQSDTMYTVPKYTTATPTQQYYSYMNPYNNSYMSQQSSINQFLKCRPVSSK